MEELFRAGGPVMWPLLGLSVLSVTAIAERCFFWVSLLLRESEGVNKIVGTARQNFQSAAQIAQRYTDTPIGRFLSAPLALEQPDPELFKLALESAADEELASMLRGEKILESVIALAPLLGLLGTITGLIMSFGSLKIGDVSSNLRSGSLTKGIAEALITTASGLIVAIVTLAFHRLFIALHHNQVNVFRKAGNDLEMLYRQYWHRKD